MSKVRTLLKKDPEFAKILSTPQVRNNQQDDMKDIFDNYFQSKNLNSQSDLIDVQEFKTWMKTDYLKKG